MRLTLLNTTIATQPGRYSLEPYPLEKARELVLQAGVQSAIGHAATAAIMSELLEYEVRVNRIEYAQKPGELALCFKLKQRVPEGIVLTREDIEAIGYEFFLLRRLPEWTDVAVVVHGSVLTSPRPSDVDVVVTRDTPEVRSFLRHELGARGWGHLTMDIQEGNCIPALPFVSAGPVLPLHGWLPHRQCWDLSAWIRACEYSELARREYTRLLGLRFEEERLDSRTCGQDKAGIIFVAAENPGQVGAYHGGGRQALLTAEKKAPLGWAYCMAQLPEGALVCLTKWLETGELPPSLSRYLHTAPTSSQRELWMTSTGLLGAYAQNSLSCWNWSLALHYEAPPQPAVCGTRGDGAFGGPRTK